MQFNYLSTIVFLPLVGAILVALLGGGREKLIKFLSVVFTAIPLILSVIAFFQFDRSAGAATFQFEEKAVWIPAIKASFYLGVDGLSLPMVVLTAFLGLMVVLISWKIHLRVREYFAWLLLLEASILGVFASLDLLLFFVFWEIEIIPMYFLISVWGSGRKEYSSIKYVIFTLFGSAFKPFYTLFSRKYYFDELYENIIVKISLIGGLFAGLEKIDTYIVDGTVNTVAKGAYAEGRALRKLQTGQLQLYGLVIGIGILAIILVLFVFG